MTFQPGQTVLLTGVNMKAPQEVQIVRVGTKNAYIEIHGREQAFDRETGHEKGNWAHHRIRTPEQFADDVRRADATDELRHLGVNFESWSGLARRLPNEVLISILQLVRPFTKSEAK